MADYVLVEWILEMAAQDVPMDVMTAVARSDGYDDSDIAEAYDEVAQYTSTEIVGGQFYIRT
jgi:hypothetical protein